MHITKVFYNSSYDFDSNMILLFMEIQFISRIKCDVRPI